MRGLLPLVDVCIANDEDSRQALGIVHGTGSLACGIEESDAYVAIARDICTEFGCSLVASVVRDVACVERSQWMGLLYDAATAKSWTSPVHDVQVLEGVAAGDAFSAGLIHGLLHALGPQELVDYAIAASVLKLTIRGDSNLVDEKEVAALAKSSDGGRRVSR
jgi:2-dehydro-3-deoxygluconokinase